MFIDEAEIYVKAGDGGDGCVSFRREAGVPRGGPNGGDGGDGGSCILRARAGLDTLLDFRGRHHWRAENGEPGRGKDQFGAKGEDLLIDVPPGTLVYDRRLGILIKDLKRPGMQATVARGGRGGRGNKAFATATDQTPRLGIVEAGIDRRFVMADLPGLIEGAHQGVGLGDEFLRHIERTRVLVHLVEVEPETGQTPAEAYRAIRQELAAYSGALAEKRELVVLTKADLLGGDDSVRREFTSQIDRPVLRISNVTGEGLESLVARILDLLDRLGVEPAHESRLVEDYE